MDASGFDLADARVGERALLETFPLPDAPHAAMLRAARDALCASLRARRLTAILSDDWQDLARVNRRNLDSWVPLLHRAPSLPSFWVGAVDDDTGEVVATQAGLLVDCTGRSFGDRLSDLSMFYDRPGDAPAGERCFVGSDLPFDTDGLVCWIAAGWTHPTLRGRGVFHVVGRLVRVVSWARWAPSWWCGVVTPDIAPVWSAAKAGPRHIDRRPSILYQQAGVERPPLHFLRLGRGGVQMDLGALAARRGQ
ncbi:hypothetical protein [Azospirillum sp. ST 5-10]|uniref:hypothetical protein n=1 Tax=unclassified Azospirillum TaxID=2630922 RepID=UPI003F4A3C92